MESAVFILAVLISVGCGDATASSPDNQCTQLRNRYNPVTGKLCIRSKCSKLVVMSTYRASSQVSAALLAAAIRHRLGFEDVITRIDNSTLCELATNISAVWDQRYSSTDEIEEVPVHVDAIWRGPEENCPAMQSSINTCLRNINTCSIAGHHLQVVGAQAANNVGVYASLSKRVREDGSNCQYADEWAFYRDRTAVERCGFLPHGSSCIQVLIQSDMELPLEITHMLTMNERDGIQFCNETLTDRAKLKDRIDSAKTSFLFIDFDLWRNYSEVKAIQLPPRFLIPTLNGLRVADVYTLRQFAFPITTVLSRLTPQPEDIRQIIEINAITPNIDEAVCTWANSNDNNNKFDNWTYTEDLDYWEIHVVLCDADESINEYLSLLRLVSKHNKLVNNKMKIMYKNSSCSDPHFEGRYLEEISRERKWQWIAGVVAAGSGAEAGVSIARTSGLETLLILYDVPPTRARLNPSGSSSTGRLQNLAIAIRHFFKQHGWQRIAFISETFPLAEDLTTELISDKLIKHREIKLPVINASTVAAALTSLRADKGRIFFINTGPKVANMVACEALRLGMASAKYAWIAREWYPTNKCDKLEEFKVFTVSYSWRGGDDSVIQELGGDAELRRNITTRLGNSTWLPLAAPLVDAILLIVHGFGTMRNKKPEFRHNIHAPGSTAYIADLLNKTEYSIPGVSQTLRLHDNALAQPVIYVTSWRANSSEILALWRMDEDSKNITEVKHLKEAYTGEEPPYDGTSQCITTSTKDPFSPDCHDPIWITGVVMIIIAIIALYAARKARLKRLERRDKAILIRLLARCERTATALASHLVDRSALKLYEELGAGHFGRVRLGVLRLPNSAPMSVAAKALRKDAAPAEEAEFLREGCALASLDHAHVVKLVGVCAADGPPLLLMENAFFGDLLHYLRDRRYLAEMHEQDPYMHDRWSFPMDPETAHVAPLELTRLAREAASALAYLSTQHYIHRDVRAANCLVDGNRRLKLADFGMARKVGKSTIAPTVEPIDSEYKYICQRRGVFPVPWMAPESLDRGEFSYASDIWALGVLILEIATLGARPFGEWRPPRVLLYVRSGGRPPLPRDASYHTCEVTDMCWHLSPTRRATASEIETYLTTHGQALRAALRSAWPELDAPDATDSGFGERNGDVDWPQSIDLRVSTL